MHNTRKRDAIPGATFPGSLVALCGLRGSELGDFSVIGVEIRFRDILMAFPALRQNIQPELAEFIIAGSAR